MNVRQDVSLNWTLQINSGGKPFILCGTSTDGLDEPLRIKDTLFVKRGDQDKPRPYDGMPSKFSGRVNMIWQRQTISLSIQRVDLSDEGFYMCEVSTLFVTAREKIFLQVIGKCEFFFIFFCTLSVFSSAFSRTVIRVQFKQGDGPASTITARHVYYKSA